MIRWPTDFLEVDDQEEKCSTKGEGVVEQLEQITTLQMGGKLLEQERGITSSMDKFRIELWSRDGERKIKWEEHNQVKIGGKEQNREKGDIIWLEQYRQITNESLREIGESYISKYIKIIPSWAGYRKKRKFKNKTEKLKSRISMIGNLVEQSEEITPPQDGIITALTLGRGREGWGDSRLSPAPKPNTRSIRPDHSTRAFDQQNCSSSTERKTDWDCTTRNNIQQTSRPK